MRDRVGSFAMACEIFKGTRSQWMTRRELAELIGASQHAVSNWTNEFHAQGILVGRKRAERDGDGGPAAWEFTLAPQWGGQGFGSPQDEPDRVAASVGQDT